MRHADRCDRCQYFDEQDAGDGLCRAHPPSNADAWPRVLPTDWCGEFASDVHIARPPGHIDNTLPAVPPGYIDNTLPVPEPPVTPPIDPPPTGADVHYYDDFTSYTDDAQFISGDARKPGNFWYAPSGHDMGGVANNKGIFYDADEQAMRYDWQDRSNQPCTGSEITIALMPRWTAAPHGMKNLWIQFRSKESADFAHGNPNCGGRSYKYFLIAFESGAVMGRAGAYLMDGPSQTCPPEIATRLAMDLNSPSAQSGVQGGLDIGGDDGWGGEYHEWTLGLENLCSQTCRFSTYLDGKLVHEIVGPFLDGQTIVPGWALTLEMGANMNSGPPKAQSRWWKKFAVYTARPAGLTDQ